MDTKAITIGLILTVLILAGILILADMQKELIECQGNLTMYSGAYGNGFIDGYNNATLDFTRQIVASLNDYGAIVINIPSMTDNGTITMARIKLVPEDAG